MSPRAQGAVWCPCQTSSEFYPINPQMCQGSSWIQREGSADRESGSVGDYKKNWPQKRIGIRKLSRSHQSDSLYKYALFILCSHGSLLIEMGPRSSRLKHVTVVYTSVCPYEFSLQSQSSSAHPAMVLGCQTWTCLNL